MDKFEYKVRADEIKELIAARDYEGAAAIADMIDWRRVKSVMMLCTISDLYKINKRYEDAKIVLLLAYDRRPGSKTICYSLCELCLKTEEFVSAVNFYKEYAQAAPNDPGRFILQYKIYCAQDVGIDERIRVLENLKALDYREKWGYELASLYHKVGEATRCVEECDDLIVWFGEGKYVYKAMELKMLHEPLTESQQLKYDHRFDEPEETEEAAPEAEEQQNSETEGEEATETVDEAEATDVAEEEYPEESAEGEEYPEEGYPEEAISEETEEGYDTENYDGGQTEEIVTVEEESEADMLVKPMDLGQYNTINLQAELAEELRQVLDQEEREKAEAALRALQEGQTKIFDIREVQAGLQKEGFVDDATTVMPLPDDMTGPVVYEMPEEEEAETETVAEEIPAQVETEQEEETAESSEESEEVIEEYSEAADEMVSSGMEEIRFEETPSEEAVEEEIPEELPEEVEQEIVEEAPEMQGDEVVAEETAPEQIDTGYFKANMDPAQAAELIMKQMREESLARAEHIHPPKEMEDVLKQESDGQISLVLPGEASKIDEQITGQINIDEVLAEWERVKKEREIKRQAEVRQYVLDQTGPMFTEFEIAVRDGLLEQYESGQVVDTAAETEETSFADAEIAEETEKQVVQDESEEGEVEYDELPDEEEIYDDATTIHAAQKAISDEAEAVDEENAPVEDYGEVEEIAEVEETATVEEDAEDETTEETFEEETFEEAEEEVAEETETEEIVVEAEDVIEEAAETEEVIEEAAEEETVTEETTEEVVEPAEDTVVEETETVAETADGQEVAEADTAEQETLTERAIQTEAPEAEETKVEEANVSETKAETEEAEVEKAEAEKQVRPVVEREKAKVRALTKEEKDLYAPFIQSRADREKLVRAIDEISLAAYTGNIILTGEEESDTLTLAKNLIKEVQVADSNFSGRVAKISGRGMNKKSVEETFEHLKNGALIIHRAAEMSKETLQKIYKNLNQDRFGIIVVILDNKREMNAMLKANPELYTVFTARMDVEPMSNETLAKLATKYAYDCEYSIDEIGMMALHARIEEMQTSDHDVTISEVKELVDEAIYSANRKTIGHFFDILLGKRYDAEDMIILTEKDFK